MISTMHEALIAEQETVPLPKITQKLPRVQFVQPVKAQMPVHLNVLDACLRVDAVQRTLLTRLLLLGGGASGTLDELHDRLKVPVTRGDLYALYEHGYIALGYSDDSTGVWCVEVRRP